MDTSEDFFAIWPGVCKPDSVKLSGLILVLYKQPPLWANTDNVGQVKSSRERRTTVKTIMRVLYALTASLDFTRFNE